MGMAKLSPDVYAGIEQTVNQTILGKTNDISLRSAFGMDQSLQNVAQGLRYDSIDTNPGLNQ